MGSRPFRRVLLLLFWLLIPTLQAQEAPGASWDWRYISGGRILGDPVIDSQEQVYFLAEDRRITSVNSFGQLVWSQLSTERFYPHLSLGPLGQLAYFTRDNRLHLRNSQGELLWSYALDQPPQGPAVILPGGRVLALTQGGSLFVLSSGGQLLWSRLFRETLRFSPVWDWSGRIFLLVETGQLLCINDNGQELWRRSLTSRPLSIMTSAAGQLLVIQEASAFSLWDYSGNQLGRGSTGGDELIQAMERPDGHWLLVTRRGLQLRDDRGVLVRQISIPGGPVGPGVMDVHSRTLLPLEDSRIGIYSSSLVLVETMDLGDGATGLALGSQGLLVAGSRDWGLRGRIIQGASPGFWSHYRGGAGNNALSTRASELNEYLRPWAQENQYQYWMALVATGRPQDHQRVLDEAENLLAQGNWEREYPYLKYIVLEIADAGIRNLRMENRRLVNNYPDIRIRAYGLLGEMADPTIRSQLLRNLRLENDRSALIQGVRTLADIGWDADGLAMEYYRSLLNAFPRDEFLARQILGSAEQLYLGSGPLVLNDFLSIIVQVIRGQYGSQLRREAQETYQRLIRN